MRKLFALFISAVIITIMYSSAGAEQSQENNMPATMKEVNVEVNGDGVIIKLFAYELNTLQYSRVQDICKAADLYVYSASTQKTIWINTGRRYENANNLPNPEKKNVYVKPEKIQIYCNGLLYTSYSSFTIDGDLYVSINDIVNATNNAANLLNMPYSSQPPRIILLESNNPTVAGMPPISSGDACRYLTMYYDKAADILRLSVITKIRTNVAVEIYPWEPGGKQFIPVYPIQSQATPLSP